MSFSIDDNFSWLRNTLIYIFHDDCQSKKNQSLVLVLHVDKMFCKIEPCCDIIFYVISCEVYQRVTQNCSAILKNKLFLYGRFRTFYQRPCYLLFQSLTSKPLRKTTWFFLKPRMFEKFLITHSLFWINDKHLFDEVLSKRTN